MGARQVTAEMSPAELREVAQEYSDLLKKSNVSIKFEDTMRDMERRCAELNGQTVEEWKARWDLQEKSEQAAAEEDAKPKKRASKRAEVVEIDPNYFWISEQNRAKGTMWMKLRQEMHIVQNMLVIGPSGCGKTEGIKKLGEQFNVPVYKIDCASITTPDRWVGHKELITKDGQTVTEYVKSNHLKWLAAEDIEPGIVLYDEINRLPASLLNTLIPVLDGSQEIWVPDLGIYSAVNPQTMIAATANLGVGYSGTYGMDIALQDRFGTVMEQTFPPANEESQILMRRTGIEKEKADLLVKIATQCRNKANDGTLSKYVSTRALIDCAFYVGAGMTVVDAADTTFLKKFNGEGGAESEQAIVRLTVSGMAGDK